MILDVTKSTLNEIKNPALRDYANIYVQIYGNFMEQVQALGLQIEAEDSGAVATQKIGALRKKGAVVRNSDNSIYVNRISPSCAACQTGIGSTTFFISLKCHRDCFYCFNPNQENYEYYCEHTRDTVAELDEMRKTSPRMGHLALTGGEPLLYKNETYRFFEHARELYPNARTRLYTSGDHIDRATLEALQKSGLKFRSSPAFKRAPWCFVARAQTESTTRSWTLRPQKRAFSKIRMGLKSSQQRSSGLGITRKAS